MQIHKMSDVVYLRHLAERLMHIPVMYGTDHGDISRLYEIAAKLDRQNLSNKAEG